MQIRKHSRAPKQAPPTHRLQDLGDLPLDAVSRHLDARSLGMLRCVCKSGVLPPRAAAAAARNSMSAQGTMPPPSIAAAWREADWLLHAHTSEQTTECPDEADQYNSYVARYGPSQGKMLRLQHDATVAWRRQGRLISEYLEPKRKAGMSLRSLDFSALFFPPFPGLSTLTCGFPVEHLRFSTGKDPYETLPPMPLRDLFKHTPKLRTFELAWQKHGAGALNFDQDFEIDAFCLALADALKSSHAPELCELKLDFTRVRGPLRPSIQKALEQAVAKRVGLTQVCIVWPA